jgi:uncharacterized membrane protein
MLMHRSSSIGKFQLPLQPRFVAPLVVALLAGCGLAADGDAASCADHPSAPGCGPGLQVLDLPEDLTNCTVNGASTDGSILVGACATEDSPMRSVRWERSGGVEILDLDGPTMAMDVSADGAMVVGVSGLSNEGGYLYDTAPRERVAVSLSDVSDDGSVVVGWDFEEFGNWDTLVGVRGHTRDGDLAAITPLELGLPARLNGVSGDGRVSVGIVGDRMGTRHAAYWTADGTPTVLEALPGAVESSAESVNRDGSVIVGTVYLPSDETPMVAVRWTRDGVEVLGDGAGFDVSADGSRIFFWQGPDTQPAIWQAGSVQVLSSWLASRATELSAAEPPSQLSVYGMTRDGRSVFGTSTVGYVTRVMVARLPE